MKDLRVGSGTAVVPMALAPAPVLIVRVHHLVWLSEPTVVVARAALCPIAE